MGPKQEKVSGDRSGYPQYEYQFLATVWVALELILRRQMCDAITVEPASEEDVAADLTSHISGAILATPVQIQIKSRQPGHWTLAPFKDVLYGTNKPAAKKGPQRRERPLTTLKKDKRLRYLFITDAQLEKELQPHRVGEIGGASAARRVPGETMDDAATAERIGIMDQRSPERLKLEIRELLGSVGRVPAGKRSDCIEALKEAVRDRLLPDKEKSAQLDRAELEIILRRFSGMPGEGPTIVQPSNFDTIERQLADKHVLVLTGPPGTGKSLVGEHLAHLYRDREEPFEIVTVNDGIDRVRDRLRSVDVCLFFLEDPWGRHRIESEAARWADELPKLIAQAGPTKKFLIVSRVAILKQALKEEENILTSAEVFLLEDHYTPAMRRAILEIGLREATARQRDFATRWMREIIHDLPVPWSLAVFSGSLCNLSDPERADIDQLIRDSKIAAIGRNVAQLLEKAGSETAAGGVILWALFMADGVVSESAVTEARRAVESRIAAVDPNGALERLASARWAQRDAGSGFYRVHPTVLEGLELLTKESRALADRVLMALLEGETASGRAGRALAVIKRTVGQGLSVPATVQSAIDGHLATRAARAHEAEFAAVFWDLVRFGHGSDPVTLMAHAIHGRHDRERWTVEIWEPVTLSEEVIASIRSSPDAQHCVEQWVEHVLPDSHQFFFGQPKLLEFLGRFGWDLSGPFSKAAVTALESGSQNAPIRVLVEGSLSGPEPDFDGIFHAILEARDGVLASHERSEDLFRSINQAEIDLEYGDHMGEQAGEEIGFVDAALEAAVTVRRRRKGYAWLLRHRRKSDLLQFWADALDFEAKREEVSALVKECGSDQRRTVWWAIRKARCHELAGELLYELESADVEHLGELMDALVAAYSDEQWDAILVPAMQALSPARRASIFHVWHLSDPAAAARRTHLAKRVLDDSLRAVEACERRRHRGSKPAEPLSSNVRESLRLLAREASGTLAETAVRRLAELGEPVDNLLARLLASTDPVCRVTAIDLWPVKGEADLQRLRDALRDSGEYRVRRAAILRLAPHATADDRKNILALSEDKSGPCREACAQVIGENRWPDGIPVLIRLLRDTRDEGHSSAGTSDYHVARRAAQSLDEFGALSREACESILSFLQNRKSRDDLWLCAKLVDVLGVQPDDRCLPFLESLLDDSYYLPGMEGGGFPLRYAAAWSVLGHLIHRPETRQGKISVVSLYPAAVHPDARLAGPSLVGLGLLGKVADEHLKLLSHDEEITAERAVLAIYGRNLSGLNDVPAGLESIVGAAHPALLLLRLVQRSEQLTETHWGEFRRNNPEIDVWIESLLEDRDVNGTVRLVIRWILGPRVKIGFKADEIRERDLPKPIPVLRLVS